MLWEIKNASTQCTKEACTSNKLVSSKRSIKCSASEDSSFSVNVNEAKLWPSLFSATFLKVYTTAGRVFPQSERFSARLQMNRSAAAGPDPHELQARTRTPSAAPPTYGSNVSLTRAKSNGQDKPSAFTQWMCCSRQPCTVFLLVKNTRTTRPASPVTVRLCLQQLWLLQAWGHGASRNDPCLTPYFDPHQFYIAYESTAFKKPSIFTSADFQRGLRELTLKSCPSGCISQGDE